MSTMKRTPPNKKQPENPRHIQTSSESDIGSAVMSSDFVNKSRSKRPRSANSPQSGSNLNLQNLQDTITNWREDQDSTLSTILADILEIKAQNAQIKASNDEIRKCNEELRISMSFINKQFEDLKQEVEGARKERQEQLRHIQYLERKITDLQHKSRSSGIEVRNIPQDKVECNTTLMNTVSKVAEAVGVQVSHSEIRDIYRLPGKSTNPATPRPIIVDLLSVQKRQALISAVRSYNAGKPIPDKLSTSDIGILGTKRPIYITEQLPGDTKRLFYQAREFAKRNAYKFCWVSNGNIFLRKCVGDKQILVNSERNLLDTGNII